MEIIKNFFLVLIPILLIETISQFIFLNTDGKKTTYNVEDKIMEGNFNPLSEDLRDYLRRRGIKIYTGRLFESI